VFLRTVTPRDFYMLGSIRQPVTFETSNKWRNRFSWKMYNYTSPKRLEYIYIYIERAPTRGDPNRIVPKEKKR